MKNHYSFWSLFAFLLIFKPAFSQNKIEKDTGINIVPNPGFEELKPKKKGEYLEPFMEFRKRITKWNSPTETTPDLLSELYSNNNERPHSGNYMIGILTHNPKSKKSETWREYVQVRLDLELEIDEEYLIEFWVMRHPQATIASNNIGALLSRIPFATYDVQPITELDLAVNAEEIINPGQPEWQKISAIFTARGDERFLLIGNFFDNENTTFKNVKNTTEPAWDNPYYLLDDVSIRKLEEPGLADMDVKKGDVIKLDKIYFESNKWNILFDSYKQLDELVSLMGKYPRMKISINGHTDSRGRESYNKTVSTNRSRAVYDYLVSKSIDPHRLKYAGYGESYPVDTNDTEEGRRNNRRVEFVIVEVDELEAMREKMKALKAAKAAKEKAKEKVAIEK